MAKLTKAEIEANINEWLTRLESGKLSQTTGVLKKRNGSMCCLGVACEVIGLEKQFEVHNNSYVYFGEVGHTDALEIPYNEYRKVGLKTASGMFTLGKDKHGYDVHCSLAGLNDGVDEDQADFLGVKIGKKYSFKEIAAVIRSKPKGLFNDDYDIAPAQS